MAIIGNILWILLGGLEITLAYFVGGLFMCLTIVGIPFGIQAFKIGVYSFLPFGSTHEYTPQNKGCLTTLMNIIWILLFGIWIALGHLIFGIFLCITIIGIPFGLQHFKLMSLAFAPFGADIVSKN